ncbi:hypothetical protein CGC56_00070 [Capnocytophaga canimorsus]|uniref:Uncharacterized protein n=1 Tax=Capnocytophaga canimorsus TaxID=28188 RepID=A0A250G3E5_9FLAO|nr:hypothetical protein CGC56_00070 [Capnocytophaga canimorsus]
MINKTFKVLFLTLQQLFMLFLVFRMMKKGIRTLIKVLPKLKKEVARVSEVFRNIKKEVFMIEKVIS